MIGHVAVTNATTGHCHQIKSISNSVVSVITPLNGMGGQTAVSGWKMMSPAHAREAKDDRALC